MKVLMVTERYLPIWGGAENQLRQLMPHLIKRGCEVEIVTRRFHENMAVKESMDGVTVHRIGTPGTSLFAQLNFIACLFVFLFKATGKTDICHSHGAIKMGAICWVVALLRRKKNVAKIASAGRIPKLAKTVSGRLMLAMFKRSTAIISMTKEIDEELSAVGIPQANIHLITNGVDCQRFFPASDKRRQEWRNENGLSPDSWIFLFSSRLVFGKGLDILINGWQEIVAQKKNIHLIVVGSGTDQADSVEDEVHKQVVEGKLSNVLFVGETECPEEYLSIADCFVFPSRKEGFPNALMEAMASQLPCVASRIGGVEALIDDGETGVLFESENSTDLVKQCLCIISNPVNSKSIGENARQKMLTTYSFETIAEQYTNLYNSMN